MTTVAAAITANAEDGLWFVGFAGSRDAEVECGKNASAVPVASWFRFVLAVPQGADVTGAAMNLTAFLSQSGSTPSTKFQAVAQDDPTYPSSGTDAGARPLTSASVSWKPSAWTQGTTYATPNLTSVVQEVVNRPGWVSGNHIVLMWLPVGTPSTSVQAVDYANSPSTAASISVTYTDAAPAYTGAGAPLAASAALSAAGQKSTAGTGAPAAASASLLVGQGVAVHPFEPVATVDGADVTLTWDAQSGATGYAIERDGTLVAFDIPDLTYIDAPGDGEHTYRVGVLL